MINSQIKYAFNQIETAFVGFVSDFRKRFHEITPNCPVFVMNNGDFSFYTHQKWVKTKNEEIILRTPRVVVKFEDIQMNNTEDTNMYNRVVYIFEGENYICSCRRKAYNVNIQLNIVAPNYITLLNYFEIIATFGARERVFTYEFLGNTYQSAYTITGNSIEISQQSYDASSRNCVMTTQLELQIHLLVPEINTIERWDDSFDKGDARIIYDLEQKGAKNGLFEIERMPIDESNQEEYNLNYNSEKHSYEDTNGDEMFTIKPASFDSKESDNHVFVQKDPTEEVTEYKQQLGETEDNEDTDEDDFTKALNGTELARRLNNNTNKS